MFTAKKPYPEYMSHKAQAEYMAREFATKRFWRATLKSRKRDRRIRQIGMKAVERALA